MKRVLAIVAIIFATVVADLVAYVVYLATTNPPRNTVSADSMTDDKYSGMTHAQAGFVIRPNLVIEGQRIGDQLTTIYTDSRGARSDQPRQQAIPSVDLITVGCSQSFGAGVPNEKTFTSIVARDMSLRAANYSVSGYGGVGSLVRIQEHVDQRPKIAIYAFWEDHLNRNVRRCALIDAPICLEMGRVTFDKQGKPYLRMPDRADWQFELSRRYYRETTRDSDRWRSRWTDIFWTSMRLWQQVEVWLGISDPGDKIASSDKITAAKFVLAEMKRTADANNFVLVVVFMPLYFESTVGDAPPELASFAGETGIIWISMSQRFNDLKREKREFTIPNDGHLNELGHAAVAEEIEKVLAKRHIGK